MAVDNFNVVSDLTEALDERTPDLCFYCGKPLAGLSSYWFGATKITVAFHPHCGVDFGARIIRDSLNAHYLAKPVLGALAGVAQNLSPKRLK